MKINDKINQVKKELTLQKAKNSDKNVITVREEPSAGHWVLISGDARAPADAANTLDPPVQRQGAVPDRAARVHEPCAQHLQRGKHLRHPWRGTGHRALAVSDGPTNRTRVLHGAHHGLQRLRCPGRARPVPARAPRTPRPAPPYKLTTTKP